MKRIKMENIKKEKIKVNTNGFAGISACGITNDTEFILTCANSVDLELIWKKFMPRQLDPSMLIKTIIIGNRQDIK